MPRRPVAVLDANVLYSARLRDLFVRLAIAGHYQARWTERILDECFNSLLAARPDLPGEHLLRTRHLLSIAVPDAIVENYDHLIDQLHLPDPDDRHVLAAAVSISADTVVTANLGDFPAAALPNGFTALSPDDFLMRLIHADADGVATVIDQQCAALHNPAMTIPELLNGLEFAGLRHSVAALRLSAP